MIIINLLKVCEDFCDLAMKWTSDFDERNEIHMKALDHLQKRTDVIVDLLVHALYDLHEKVTGDHISQLLNRLDFNRWYTKNNEDINLSTI